uniref:Putative salivary secreted protein n=1 Tax=Ixodes ricinus TaxID=34613 RepID=A0A6B0UAV8_IXORI
MQGQTKIIIFGTVMIVYAIQNGVLSQWPPSPFGCYEDIMEVGNIFCTITGQKECPEGLQKKFDEWKERWLQNKEDAKKAFCDHIDRKW